VSDQQPKGPGVVPDERAGWRAAVVPSVILVAYGNLATLAGWQPGDWPTIPPFGHPLFIVLAVVWARGPARLDLAALGLTPTGWRRGLLIGLAVGGVMAALVIGPMLILRALGWQSATAPILATDTGSLAGTAFRLLVASAFCEELWFHGVLQACWVRVLGPTRGILVVAVLFSAWHGVVWWWALDQVVLQPPLPRALTYPAGLAALMLAGGLFGWLRQTSGHLAGPIVAHWTIDLVLVALVLAGWL
jgi:membrane protease YdiL (CAAX protease family)